MDRFEFVKAVNNLKQKYSSEIVCSGLPRKDLNYFSCLLLGQFHVIYNYLMSLRFFDQPNYEGIQSLFIDVLNDLGEDFDFEYDWL